MSLYPKQQKSIRGYEEVCVWKARRKDWINDAGRWLRWGAFSKEYYGETAKWFRAHFSNETAPDYFSELDRQTLKAALKEVARRIEPTADSI